MRKLQKSYSNCLASHQRYGRTTKAGGSESKTEPAPTASVSVSKPKTATQRIYDRRGWDGMEGDMGW